MKRFARLAALILATICFAIVVRAQNISTFAGGGNTFSGAASSLPVGFPYKVSCCDEYPAGRRLPSIAHRDADSSTVELEPT